MDFKKFGREALMFLAVAGAPRETPTNNEHGDDTNQPHEHQANDRQPRSRTTEPGSPTSEQPSAQPEYRMEGILPPQPAISVEATRLNPTAERAINGYTKSSLSADMDSLIARHLRESIENEEVLDQISYEIDEVGPETLRVAIHPTQDLEAQYITLESGLFSVPIDMYRSSAEFNCPEQTVLLSSLEEAYDFSRSVVEFENLCSREGYTTGTVNTAAEQGNLYAMYLQSQVLN